MLLGLASHLASDLASHLASRLALTLSRCSSGLEAMAGLHSQVVVFMTFR